jgi:hypothetical protein
VLLANYAQVNRNATSDWGGAFSNPHSILKATCIHRFYLGDALVSGETEKSAWNNGYTGQHAWMPAPKAGGLGAYRTADFGFTGSANGAMGVNIVGDTMFTFTVPSAALQLVVSATGAATFTFTQTGLLAGALDAVGSTSFSFTVGPSNIGALSNAIASASFAFSSIATIRATGELAGDIVPYTELSPESLAASVWNSIAANFNTAGTMGEKMNDAGSASNPWTEVIESGYTAGEILQILAAVSVGKTTIVDNGGGSATVTFRGVADDRDAVVADMQDSERLTVTLDP